MPRYTYSGTQTFTTRAYALASQDELYITLGAGMDGQYAAGALITASGAGALVDNSGIVTNIATAIQLSDTATLRNHGTILITSSSVPTIEVGWGYIINDGTLSSIRLGGSVGQLYGSVTIKVLANLILYNSGTIATSNGGVAIMASGAVAQVVNDGMITSVGSANDSAITADIGFVLNNDTIIGKVDVGTGTMTNNGMLTGNVYGQHLANYGTITRPAGSTSALISGTASGDDLVNEGTIQGNGVSAVLLGDGDDVMYNNRGQITGLVDLGAGNDTYRALDGIVNGRISGGEGNDTIVGGSGADSISGDSGNDILFGGGGTDTIGGGAGADLIAGNQGNDQLNGGANDDLIYGGQGNDTIYGGDGADILYGDLGDDQLYGEAGSDTFVFAPSFGHDTVNALGTAAGNYDVLRFKAGTFADYADVQAHMVQAGANVVIALDAANDVTLTNINVAALTADHFLFG